MSRTHDEAMADPAGDVVAPRVQYLEEWIRDCQHYNRSVSKKLTTADAQIRDLQSLVDSKNAQLAAVTAALVVPQPNSQGQTLYESGYADAIRDVKKAVGR